MTSAPPEVWSRLRATRSAPPGRATDTPSRRRTYAAALEQFEELIRAAEQVGPAARPLPLFYALSQAGRAVTAAHVDEPWQLRGHGLQLKDEGCALLDRRVSPQGGPGTSFRRVAEATGSAVLQQPVTVGALCASLPDLAVVPELCGADPRALSVQPIVKSGGAVLVMSRDVEAYVVNLPAAIPTNEDTTSLLKEHMLAYPTMAGLVFPDPPRFFPPRDGWGAATVLRWQVSEDVQSPNESDRQARMREVAPQYRHSDQQWCRPAVAPGTFAQPFDDVVGTAIRTIDGGAVPCLSGFRETPSVDVHPCRARVDYPT